MAGLQLTSLLHRVRRLVGAGPAPGARPSQGGGTRVDEIAAGLVARLQPSDRSRWTALLAEHPDAAGLLRRELAATGRVAAVVELAGHWAAWSPQVQAAVLDPVGRLAREGRQTDQTTCGSASLVMLAAAGDPGLAGWLAAGTVPRVGAPREIAAADPARLAELTDAPAEVRFGVLQRVVKARSNSGSVLGLPWPTTLGTPPWGAAREARYPGTRFRQRLLDDTDTVDLSGVLGQLADALDAGIPVPLYAGGDSARGWSTAIPRHVVLAVRSRPDGILLWEPSAGALIAVRTADLLHGGRPLAAFGGWSHLMWAVLPA